MNQFSNTTILLAAILLGHSATDTAIAQLPVETPAVVPQPTVPRTPANPLALSDTGAQPPFATEYESHLTVRADRTGTEVSTKRIKIMTPGAVQALSQQQLQFIEGMQTLETVEAYTEKSDGRRVPVDPANIITRDAASGLQATYAPDLKQRTIIFPDVGVGDTLVMTNKTNILQGEFSGQFADFDVFPRSQSLSSVRLTIEAPASLDLAVKTTGDGITDRIEENGGVRRHTVTLVPEPYRPEEPGSVSPIDREPGVMVSTFHSYDELGKAYGRVALPKIRITPPIKALADEITRNISGHRAQATAIDGWVKKNIRYVAVFLSVGRVVPHDAEAILRNKFGDCKDKATLMASLLAAKGIASEAALINLGNTYTLPEPPTLAALNHVILYLPEFDIYDDPTANAAAFGVLAPEAYDKPVVRVAATEAKLARTPSMKPQDHTAHATTTLKFAADGTITGETRETNTGVLGMGLRLVGGAAQQVGTETVAQRQLQSFNTPGTGHIELGNASETLDPVELKSSFTLNDRFKSPPPAAIAGVPVGMPFTLRPGFYPFGARLSGRRIAFVCYAATQIEDIDATFDPTLPMPLPLPAATIDNALFSYRSTFRIENRTLKIHREFVSHVRSQVCPAETEGQISADLARVRADVTSGYRFASLAASAPPAPKPPAIAERNAVATAGQKRLLEFVFALKVDCSSDGFSTVTTVEPPQHGKITAEHGTGTSNFPPSNPRFECNKHESEGTVITYEPAPGFTGADTATVDIAYADGGSARHRFSITVNPPAVAEVARVAVADRRLQLSFVYDVNPDCSLVQVPNVRIVEQPKSGKVTVENGTGFSTYPANSPRFKCNETRSDGAVVSYMPDPGFTGADSVTVDVIYLDGFASRRRYAIEVK